MFIPYNIKNNEYIGLFIYFFHFPNKIYRINIFTTVNAQRCLFKIIDIELNFF